MKMLVPAFVLAVLALTGCEHEPPESSDLGVSDDLAGSDLSVTLSDQGDAASADGPSGSTPQVTSTNPAQGASNICVPAGVEVRFDRAMDPLTLTPAAVLLAGPGTTHVDGTVSYDAARMTATFRPTSALLATTTYKGKVTTAAKDVAGNALAADKVWTFTTGATACSPPLQLGRIATYGIASRAGMTSTGVTVVNGDVALWPNPACTDATGGPAGSARAGGCAIRMLPASSTGLTVNGSIYFFGDAFDNGVTAQAVVGDLSAAWSEGASRSPTQPTVAAGQLGGKTFVPGIYHNANLGLMAGGVAVMDAQNDANATFIFQVDTDLIDSGTALLQSRIELKNGALAKNVWFVVGRDVTVGQGTSWNGSILAGRTATVNAGATVLGRVLAGADPGLTTGALTLVGAAAPTVTTVSVP